MKQTWQCVSPSMDAIRPPLGPPDVLVVHVEGALHARLGAALRKEIQILLRRGVRTIEVCLANVSKVDAGGIGELAQAYHMTVAAGGILRVTESSERVREVLTCVGLFGILTSGGGLSTLRRL